MKKIPGYFSLTILVAGFTYITSCNNGNAASGSDFEGVVSYEIKVDSGLPQEVATFFKAVEMKTFVKGDMSRSEEKSAENTTIVLNNAKTPDDPTMLMNMFGHKYAIKFTDSMKKVQASNLPKIEYIDSGNATKQIAGYACKKAKITVNLPNSSTPITSYMYYTPDLPYVDPKGEFKGLKGMPMEFSVSMANLSITIEAKSVEKKSLPDSLFTVPSDYKQMSIADMEKDMMKNMPPPSSGDSASGNGTK